MLILDDPLQPECPIHHTTKGCPCGTAKITPDDLSNPRAIGMWRCANEHTEIGPPTLHRGHNRCVKCDRLLIRIAVGIHPGWKTPGHVLNGV